MSAPVEPEVLSASGDTRAELLRFLTSRLRCHATAEDVAQEAYLRLSTHAKEVRNPRAFLFEAAANLMRNVMRGGRRRAAFSEAVQYVLGDTETRTPERRVLAAETLTQVERAIRELPPQCGRVFYLHRFEGLTQNEIAEHLGISTTAVEKSMRRAFARLEDAIRWGEVRENPGTGVSRQR